MLIDPRITQLAELIVHYSVYVAPNERVLIESWDEADALTVAIIQAVYKRGGYPFVTRENAAIQRELLLGIGEAYMELDAQRRMQQITGMDAYIAIRKADNAFAYSDVPSDKLALFQTYCAPSKHQRMMKTKWCVLRYPNAAMAQLCQMSTDQFEQYYFDVCCVDYEAMSSKSRPLEALLQRTDRVRIVGENTALTFSIKGCNGGPSIFMNNLGCGRLNIPDGEVGGGVVKESVNGTITYNTPAAYNGTTFYDVCFVFESGKIIQATCSNGKAQSKLDGILDTDEGARYIGEFSLGIHPLINRAIGDILFDEKMWGSFHFTPGHAPSAIHWDIVCSQKAEDGGGEMWFDDVLIRKDGLFIPEALLPLNPQQGDQRKKGWMA